MKWLRSNIRHGSRLALFALALQFVLSFGHFHATSQAAPAAGLFYILNSSGDPAQQPDSDRQPADACAICALMALASTVLFSAPPSLPLPQAVDHFYLTADAALTDLTFASSAFQPRAPPAS